MLSSFGERVWLEVINRSRQISEETLNHIYIRNLPRFLFHLARIYRIIKTYRMVNSWSRTTLPSKNGYKATACCAYPATRGRMTNQISSYSQRAACLFPIWDKQAWKLIGSFRPGNTKLCEEKLNQEGGQCCHGNRSLQDIIIYSKAGIRTHKDSSLHPSRIRITRQGNKKNLLSNPAQA